MPIQGVDRNESMRPLRVRSHFREFCRSTSLHGLQYLGEEQRPWSEKLCWILMIGVSVALCSLVIKRQWDKWYSSPVMVTLSEKSTPVWDIPFPAVTLCSEVKIKPSALNFSDLKLRSRKGNLTDEEERSLEYASLLCDYSSSGKNNTVGDGAIDYMKKISPRLEEVLLFCVWRGTDMNCSDLFTTSITDAGVCYTFNALSSKDLYTDGTLQKSWGEGQRPHHWRPQEGYDTTEDLSNTYPRRTRSSGSPAGLAIYLNSVDMPKESGMCVEPLVGFQVLLHFPNVFPRMKQYHIKSPSKMRVDIAVRPRIVTTEERLRYYLPEARQCFFEGEKELRFFGTYSQDNCYLECYTNYTLRRCKCVHYYMPRNLSTPICSARRMNCKAFLTDEYLAHYHDRCQCLPSCMEVKYDVETSQVEYHWTKVKGRFKKQSNADDKVTSSSWVSLSVSEDGATRSLHPLCNKCSRVVNYSQEFCQKTSLHGLQYLGEQERPLPERACWILVILISIVCCLVVIMKQWDKWQSSPVIVTFAETSTPAWNIPFPAVTICSEMKFKQSVFNFTDLYFRYMEGNVTEEEEKKLCYTHLLCETKLYYLPYLNGTVDQGLFEHLLNISLPPEEMIAICTWRGAEVRCGEFFSLTITDDGVCYSFNNFPASELFADDVIQANLTNHTPPTKNWSPENGYTLNKDLNDTYPRRTMSAGIGAGLSAFVISQDQEADFRCRIPMEGFKMMLHNPAVFPEVKKHFFRVPSTRDVVIGVHPKIIRTTTELHNYSPKLRQCFFERERKLRFFKIYTQENCELECVTNYTLKHCRCAQYFMPRAEGTQICGPKDTGCTIELQETYNFDADNREICNCLPACTEIKYDVEISQSGYIWEPILKDEMWEKKRLGSFNIFLKDMHVITRKRSELYGSSDFLANCGGLLGLFLGFSILSLVEIVYFLSLRLFYNVRHYRRGASKLKNKD